MAGEVDLDAVAANWLRQCGPCDFGLADMGCNCPEVAGLEWRAAS